MGTAIQAVKPQVFINKKSPAYISLYSNNAAYSVNVFDVTLTFGEVEEYNHERNEITVEQKAKILMAPAQAKLLRDALVKAIDDYEVKFGAIFDVNAIQQAQNEGE
jgi:hypothetical protein